MSLTFEAKLTKVNTRQVIVIPLKSSEMLSRGMVMVQGTMNTIPFKAPLEPDGKGGHWLEVSASLSEEANVSVSETAHLTIESTNEWFEPEIPQDILIEIEKENLLPVWNSLTTKARWDWIRWIRATANPETRKKRITVACSKLKNGSKNPCCFDRSRCTMPDVSKSGVLLDETSL